MKKDMHPVISVRVFSEEKCFGPGVAELLRRVDTHHSLRAAAKSMKMAYSKAWNITKNSENALGFKLLETSAGGANGGGAVLTPKGREILEAYDRLCSRINDESENIFSEEFLGILQ